MASRRGLNNSERFALDLKNVTATGAVVDVPCYIYAIYCSIDDSTTSGKLSVGNTTAVADLVKESTRIDFKVGTAGASGNFIGDGVLRKHSSPPLYCQDGFYWAVSTGIDSVSVEYFPAS